MQLQIAERTRHAPGSCPTGKRTLGTSPRLGGVLLASLWLAMASAWTSAVEPAAAPAKAEPANAEPAKAEPATAAAVVQAAPEVLAVLDKMDAAGKDLKTIRAKFDYELYQELYEDKQERKGEIMYQALNLVRFEFTSKPVQETFVFDGRTLYHKKDATSQLITWEVRTASEPPLESLEIGKIPFPLPFGQRKEAVLKHFTASLDKAEQEADKDKRAVLALEPKKNTEMAKDYVRILLWIDPKLNIPTRVRLFDTSQNRTTVDFRSIEVDKAIDPKLLARPDVPPGWEIVAHPKESGGPKPETPTPPKKGAAD